ncbi:MAG: PaaI family thioesterase [Actinomycetes bacterium]
MSGEGEAAADEVASATGGFAPDDPVPDLLKSADGRSPRVEGLAALPDTPRRREVRRLAAAVRSVIESMVSTTASADQLSVAANELESLAAALGALPTGLTYRGFAEAANAGGLVDPNDPEWFAFFDHSPFIGLANPLSPPVRLSYNDDATRVVGEVTFGAAYEGPPSCVHGGYIAAVFDELLGATQSLSGTQGMTAHLGVDYRSPTPLGQSLTLDGWIDRRDGRKIYARGAMYVGDQLTAEAEALFIAFDRGKFRALLDQRNEGLDPMP